MSVSVSVSEQQGREGGDDAGVCVCLSEQEGREGGDDAGVCVCVCVCV